MPEKDQLLQGNYDGIEEYDNDLPLWWVWLFILTIVVSIAYVGYFHFGPGLDQHEQLAIDLDKLDHLIAEKASAALEITEEKLLALVSDQQALAKGKEVYLGKCLACHGPAGGGLVGPNLTDDYWIRGGSLFEIRKIILNGVPEKGMLAWKGILSDEEINAVTAYVRSLRGTEPQNAKGPEGELITLPQ